MDQLREHARLMESGVGVHQLVKVRDTSTFSSVAGHLWLDQLTTPPLSFAVVDCGSPTSTPDGTVSLINSTTTFNSLARYDCRPGFQEVGSAKRICKATGQWSGSEPTCQSE